MGERDPMKAEKIPLLIARSNISSDIHKTGSWRFVRPVYEEKTAPCSRTCPAGEDIAGIEMMVELGRMQEAWELILQENPFPAVCGYVCFHTCENGCNRTNMDDPVAINLIERHVGSTAISEGFPHPFQRTASNERQVAIIGAGPSGLSAAYFLSRLGYSCDIFEKESYPGGVLRWGIPAYRLPEDILQEEISWIQRMGVNLHCNQVITRSFLDQIKKQYHAVYLGCGHGRPLELNISGEEKALDGLRFLYRMRKGKHFKIKGHTAVIGGGNTAIDVARSLIRLGNEVTLVYRRRRQDMPAFSNEVAAAVKEGMNLLERVSPLEITEKGDGLALTLQRMKISGKDATGKARIDSTDEALDTLHVKSVIRAIGADSENAWYVPESADERVLRLSHAVLGLKGIPVVSGGDLTNSVKSVADAIASGKQAAMAIDVYYKDGWDVIVDRLDKCRIGDGDSLSMEMYIQGNRQNRSNEVVAYEDINTDYFNPTSRMIPQVNSGEGPLSPFSMMEPTFSQSQAMKEAGRCFQCGNCNGCDNCRLFCPEMAVDGQKERNINLDYCKGCGICVEECPRNAMSLVEEKL